MTYSFAVVCFLMQVAPWTFYSPLKWIWLKRGFSSAQQQCHGGTIKPLYQSLSMQSYFLHKFLLKALVLIDRQIFSTTLWRDWAIGSRTHIGQYVPPLKMLYPLSYVAAAGCYWFLDNQRLSWGKETYPYIIDLGYLEIYNHTLA